MPTNQREIFYYRKGTLAKRKKNARFLIFQQNYKSKEIAMGKDDMRIIGGLPLYCANVSSQN